MSETTGTVVPKTHPALAELDGPISTAELAIEANRCLYCYDAPCVQACPTHIDIPGFIRKIAQDRPLDAARTILKENLLGATCSRVCPVQELCEGACVLGRVKKPIAIGRLQRFATDAALADRRPLVVAGPSSGKRVAVVGSGPAGLSCAGVLAKQGHAVEIFEKRALPGGLSTHGIVTLREPVDIALAEVDMVKGLGVKVHLERELGKNLQWAELDAGFDAIAMTIGLGKVPPLGIPGDTAVTDGLAFVEACKLGAPPPLAGRRVLVVGAGNTAIDCASTAKRLGAAEVTIIYRRSAEEMTAYEHEYHFALKEGIAFRFLTNPVEVLLKDGSVAGLRCQAMELGEADESGRPKPRPLAGQELVIAADLVISAIGQEKPPRELAAELGLDRGFIAVDREFMTKRARVFAGGDAIRSIGAASTVMAVQDGKMLARSIHQFLSEGAHHG